MYLCYRNRWIGGMQSGGVQPETFEGGKVKSGSARYKYSMTCKSPHNAYADSREERWQEQR